MRHIRTNARHKKKPQARPSYTGMVPNADGIAAAQLHNKHSHWYSQEAAIQACVDTAIIRIASVNPT